MGEIREPGRQARPGDLQAIALLDLAACRPTHGLAFGEIITERRKGVNPPILIDRKETHIGTHNIDIHANRGGDDGFGASHILNQFIAILASRERIVNERHNALSATVQN